MRRRYLLPCVLAAALAPAAVAAAPDAQDVILMADGRPHLIRLSVTVDGRPYLARCTGYLKRWFTFLDRNGDGVLEREEAGRAPSVQLLQAMNQSGFFNNTPNNAPPFRELDADGDGKVTPGEFIAYYLRSGLGPIQLASGNVGGNGTDAASEVIFRALDTDGDGKLSKEELARADEVLRRFDDNDDEIITTQELTGTNGFGGRGFQQFGQPEAIKSVGPIVLVPVAAAARLRAAQAVLAHYDKNRDGKLSRDEIGLAADLFAKLDADKDGSLNAEELAAWFQQPVDAVLVVRLGQTEEDEEAIELLADKAGKPSLKVEKEASGAITLAIDDLRVEVKKGEPNASNNAQQNRKFYEQVFKAADKEQKGYVVADDLAGRRGAVLAPVLKIAGRDGKLTEKELFDFLALPAAGPNSLTGLVVSERGMGLFEMLDANGDGRLSLRELHDAGKRLAALDRDGTGFISRAELPRHLTLALNPGPANANPFGSAPRFRQPPPPPSGRPAKPRGPLWFRKMDLNGDGDVSRREFLGSPEEFKRIDEDGDGLISVEEAERYDSRRQAARDNR